MGGTVEVESVIGQGTTFKIEIPTILKHITEDSLSSSQSSPHDRLKVKQSPFLIDTSSTISAKDTPY